MTPAVSGAEDRVNALAHDLDGVSAAGPASGMMARASWLCTRLNPSEETTLRYKMNDGFYLTRP